ncbi:MAG: hypothetical protein IMZ62_10200, partial [Chloroflexi bacterium]|nr:hypothetical protein [Chloroflexota bacterium]
MNETAIVESGPQTMIMTPTEAQAEYKRLQAFVSGVMVSGTDYGVIPNTGNKPTLLKPGAEKLCEVYGYAPSVEVTNSVEEWDREIPFFNYLVKVTLTSKRTGIMVAEGMGSCNSKEVKYRYKTEWWNGGGDPPGNAGWYKARNKSWCKKVENRETADLANTFLKMAKKRAFIDATLSATRSSELFTQDVEDIATLQQEDTGGGEHVEDAVIKCDACKKPIEGYTNKAGTKTYTVADIIRYSQKDYGKNLCKACGFKAKDAKEATPA